MEHVCSVEFATGAGRLGDVTVSPDGNWVFSADLRDAGCGEAGMHVIDASDLSAPAEAAFIEFSYGSRPSERVQVVPLTTRYFSGDVLVSNGEVCATPQAPEHGGIALIDVSTALER